MSEHERAGRAIRRYVRLELSEEPSFVEERVALYRDGRRHSLWEVHVQGEAVGQPRWWVTYPLVMLISATDFPTSDSAFKQYLGELVLGSGDSTGDSGRMRESWRRWRDAVAELEGAVEAETIQAVGMRCRECLLALIREAGRPEYVVDDSTPQGSNFTAWIDLIVSGLCPGDRYSRHRRLMRDAAVDTWMYVNWLTHERAPVQADGRIAIAATEFVLNIFSNRVAGHQEEQGQDRCPECNSYRVTVEFRPDGDPYHYDDPSVVLCEACGWEYRPPNQEPKLLRILPRPSEPGIEDQLGTELEGSAPSTVEE